MSSNYFQLAAALFVGVVVGAFYFGSLWLVVRRVHQSRNPGLRLFASFLVRQAVVLAALFFVMDGRWERLVACLVGIVIARQVIVSRVRPAQAATGPTRELLQ